MEIPRESAPFLIVLDSFSTRWSKQKRKQREGKAKAHNSPEAKWSIQRDGSEDKRGLEENQKVASSGPGLKVRGLGQRGAGKWIKLFL